MVCWNKYMKIDKDFLKNIKFNSHVDISDERKAYNPIIFNKSYWMNDTLFKWTEEEIDNADNGYIGTKYGIDCYITNPLQAVNK